MDIIFHAACGLLFKNKPRLWWRLAFFGALPDLIGSVSFFGLEKNWQFYHFGHSLLAIVLLFIILIITRQNLIFILPYLLHILIDISTHQTGTGSLFFPFKDFIGFSSLNWWQFPIIPFIFWELFLIIILIKIRRFYQKNYHS